MKRTIMLVLMAVVAIVIFYLSRYWFLTDLWPRSGLFGVAELRPQGGLLGRWLRGTQYAPFELLIWGCGAFVILTWLQKLFDLLSPPPPETGEEDDS